MARLKVTTFVEYFPPRMGSDRRIFEFMKRLASKHEIHFIVFPPVRALINKSSTITKEANPKHENISTTHDGIVGHYIEIPSLLKFLWKKSILIAYAITASILLIKTIKKLETTKPDIIVLNYPSPYTGLLGFIAGKLWRKPILLDFNDLIAQYTINLLNIKKDNLKAKVLVYIQNYIAKKSEMVVVPTSFIKKYVISNGTPTAKVILIPNGADPEIFNPQKYAKKRVTKIEKVCAYCGRLDSWAGVNIIAKLCDAANDRKVNVKFIIIGGGEGNIPQKENVILYGEIPHEEVPSVLTTADIILVPFPNNEISHAASPIKLFEAMSMQKPVIASRVSGIEEVISDGENGFLASPENIEEWITKIEQILRSEENAMRVGQNARQIVQKKFNWNYLAIQFEKALITTLIQHDRHNDVKTLCG
ncbi:MAG: glycosyltransferase family 4 protein [Candidatus Bathyarchaeales archaeon]